MSHAVLADEPGGTTPAVLSALVHAVLLVVLVFGLRWQAKHPDAVVVELWNQLPAIEPTEPRKIEPKAEAKPLPKPKVEAKQPKPDIAVEREKKPPKKQPAKEDPPLKFDTTDRIREQLAQEQRALTQTREKQEALKQSAPPAAPPSPDAGYVDRIRSRIKANIALPLEIKGNPEAIFEVVQMPTGVVLSVHLKKSSGHGAYDEAVERAIRKSSPLPTPERPDQFRRELVLKFRPLE